MGFRGGYKFKNFEGAAEPVLRECAIPKSVFIPAECSSIPFTPLVENGDPIRAGQRIFEADDGTAVYLVSPVNGAIKNVTGEGITIAADGTTNFEPVEGHTRAPWHLETGGHFRGFLLVRLCGAARRAVFFGKRPRPCQAYYRKRRTQRPAQ